MADRYPKRSKRGTGPKHHIFVVLNPLQIDDEVEPSHSPPSVIVDEPTTTIDNSSSTTSPPVAVETIAETLLKAEDTLADDRLSKALVVVPSHHDHSLMVPSDDGDNNNDTEVIDIDMTGVMERRKMETTIVNDRLSKALVVVPSHHDHSVMITSDDGDNNNDIEVINIDMTDVMERRNKITKKPMHIYKINHIAVTKEFEVEAPVVSSSVDQTLFQEVISTLLGTSHNALPNSSQANHSRSYEVKGAVERVYRISSSSSSSSSSTVNHIPVQPITDTLKPSIDHQTTTFTTESVAKDLMDNSSITHASPSGPEVLSLSTGNQTITAY